MSRPQSKTRGATTASAKSRSVKSGKSDHGAPVRSASTKKKSDDEEANVQDLAWQYLSADHVKELEGMGGLEEITEKLGQLMELEDIHGNLKDSIQADFYLGIYCFATQNKYSDSVISALVTIGKRLLKTCAEKMDISASINDFKYVLMDYTVGLEVPDNVKSLHDDSQSSNIPIEEEGGSSPAIEDPAPVTEKIFEIEEAETITGFFQSTFFQHFRLFKTMMMQEQELEVISTNTVIENTLSDQMKPLSVAITEEEHNRRMEERAEKERIYLQKLNDLTEDDAKAIVALAVKQASVQLEADLKSFTDVNESMLEEGIAKLEVAAQAAVKALKAEKK
eukprot:Nk52_evm71s2039 gene=Nk52_evmTU71s2039